MFSSLEAIEFFLRLILFLLCCCVEMLAYGVPRNETKENETDDTRNLLSLPKLSSLDPLFRKIPVAKIYKGLPPGDVRIVS